MEHHNQKLRLLEAYLNADTCIYRGMRNDSQNITPRSIMKKTHLAMTPFSTIDLEYSNPVGVETNYYDDKLEYDARFLVKIIISFFRVCFLPLTFFFGATSSIIDHHNPVMAGIFIALFILNMSIVRITTIITARKNITDMRAIKQLCSTLGQLHVTRSQLITVLNNGDESDQQKNNHTGDLIKKYSRLINEHTDQYINLLKNDNHEKSDKIIAQATLDLAHYTKETTLS